MSNREALLWLWQLSDVLYPSIYPHSDDPTSVAAKSQNSIEGALLAADYAANNSATGARPAVFPYARALIQPGLWKFSHSCERGHASKNFAGRCHSPDVNATIL